ncbi:MAG: hypothetical protein WBD75_09790 [Phycisphaerae bacterium]
MKDPPKGWRWTVRAGVFAAAVFVAAGLALGARKAPKKTLPKPSYGIPNIVAVVMCLSVLAIPCKRFKRT